MIEPDKYRVNTIQIVGLALMTPFGNLVLNVFGFNLFKFGLLFFLFYISLTLILFYFGIVCLLRGLEIIEEAGNK